MQPIGRLNPRGCEFVTSGSATDRQCTLCPHCDPHQTRRIRQAARPNTHCPTGRVVVGCDKTFDDESGLRTHRSEVHGVFEVEKVVSHRSGASGREYRVRWLGFGARDDTWEPEEVRSSLVSPTSTLSAAAWLDHELTPYLTLFRVFYTLTASKRTVGQGGSRGKLKPQRAPKPLDLPPTHRTTLSSGEPTRTQP